MAEDINSVLKEIEEEVKQEELYKFFRKHQQAIGWGLLVIVLFIFGYSSWYNRRNREMESATTTLVEILQTPTLRKHDATLAGLLRDAPAEMKPILTLIKSGRKLASLEEVYDNSDALLALSRNQNVHVVWRDIAVIICASYHLASNKELIDMLKPLTAEGRPFRLSALEMMAIFYEKEGNHEEAFRCLESILADKKTPNTMHKRIGMLLNYLRNKDSVQIVEKKK